MVPDCPEAQDLVTLQYTIKACQLSSMVVPLACCVTLPYLPKHSGVQGCKATICMPTSTPGIKIDAVRRLGGNVELVGEGYSETQTYAQVIVPSPLLT